MRYFFSTGEPSGEAMRDSAGASRFAASIRRREFEGIGARGDARRRDLRLWRDHTGWASMGPLAAIPRIPKLLDAMLRTALSHPRIEARSRRARRFRRVQSSSGEHAAPRFVTPDRSWISFRPERGSTTRRRRARVSSLTVPVTAFAHQYEFYRSIGCRIDFFGHPLASRYRTRPLRAPAPR